MPLYEVFIRIHIMLCIHVSKCPHKGLKKSVEAPPELLHSLILTNFCFLYIFREEGVRLRAVDI